MFGMILKYKHGKLYFNCKFNCLVLLASGVVPDNLFLGQTQAHGSLEQCLWTNLVPGKKLAPVLC